MDPNGMSWGLDILLQKTNRKMLNKSRLLELCTCWVNCEAQDIKESKVLHQEEQLSNRGWKIIAFMNFLRETKSEQIWANPATPPRSRKRSIHFSSRTMHMPNESRLDTSVLLDWTPPISSKNTSWESRTNSGPAPKTNKSNKDTKRQQNGYRRHWFRQ